MDAAKHGLPGAGGGVPLAARDALADHRRHRAVQPRRRACAHRRAFPDFIRQYHYAEDVDLKLGIYSGPCFAVTANGVLDYFAQTVNIAARLQSQAEAGDLVLPEELADAAAAGGWLAGSRINDRFSGAFKGVNQPIRVVRVSAQSLAPGEMQTAALGWSRGRASRHLSRTWLTRPRFREA